MCVNRFIPSQVEMQGKVEIKKPSERRRGEEGDLVWKRKKNSLSFAPCSHSADMTIKHAANSPPTHLSSP